MPHKNLARRQLASRGTSRTYNHGNWRQVYIDCMGLCVAHVNGDELPCGAVTSLEFHELWGENGHSSQGKFQQRVLMCNKHHALVEGRAHQAALILDQYKPSRLQDDVQLEIVVAGGYRGWVERYHLDDGRSGCLLFSGPHIDGYEERAYGEE